MSYKINEAKDCNFHSRSYYILENSYSLTDFREIQNYKDKNQNSKIWEQKEKINKSLDEKMNLESKKINMIQFQIFMDIQKSNFEQDVLHNGKEIGKIVYECKKVKKYLKEYIVQTRKARQDRAADYAILVTNQFPPKAHGYFVENQVFVVSPIGVELISQTLRGSLVQLSLLKGDPVLKNAAIQ